MNDATVLALRAVLAGGLAGSVFVQAVMVPLLALDLDGAPPGVRWPVVTIVVLGIATIQVTMVCVWRLTTLVRRGAVFSDQSFRYVDWIVGAVTGAALLLFILALIAAPGEDVAPGLVLLIGGAGGLVTGVALLVLVLRTLLAQAVELRTELDAVI